MSRRWVRTRVPGARFRAWSAEEGQTMTEYAVVIATITLAIIAAFAALSSGIVGAIDRATGLLP